MCVTIRSLPFTTGVKPISLSGFNRRVGIGSRRKNLIFAPCAAAMGFYACTFGGFCAILQKAARLSHTVLLLQLIPARGRKHLAAPFHACHASCNLSPRGDGNVCLDQVAVNLLVATYPREGTETLRSHQTVNSLLRCNLSPRGDGNHLDDRLKLEICRCNLSPRGDGNSR